MKLRNKKTGEIIQINIKCENGGELMRFDTEKNQDRPISLAELNEEWEDAPEEPKVIYYLSWDGAILHSIDRTGWQDAEQIGNYFETEEEAELAVRKLKAWKRLKDVGFKFNNFVRDVIYYEISDEEIEKDVVREDLDLLFGGEDGN